MPKAPCPAALQACSFTKSFPNAPHRKKPPPKRDHVATSVVTCSSDGDEGIDTVSNLPKSVPGTFFAFALCRNQAKDRAEQGTFLT
jgi:hypothetical protein